MRAREARHEADGARLLVAGKLRTAVLDQFALAHRDSVLGDDEGGHCFAPFRIGQTDDGDFGDRRMARQHVFDFLGDDGAAAGPDHLLEPANDEEIPGLIEFAGIARMQPAFAQREPALGLVAPVSRHDVSAADQDFACAARTDGRARKSHLVARQHLPDRMDQPLAFCALPCQRAGRQIAGDRGLGQAIEDADLRPDQLQRALEYCRRYSRSADVDRLQPIKPGIARQEVIEPANELGRHQRGPPCTAARDAIGKGFGIEPAQHYGRARKQI